MKPGDKVQHKITVTLINPEQKKVLPVVQGRDAQLSISTTPVLAKPALGVRMAKHGQALSEAEADRIRALRLSHLRGDVTFSHDWREELRAASQEANQLRLSLQCALHLGTNPESELVDFVRARSAPAQAPKQPPGGRRPFFRADEVDRDGRNTAPIARQRLRRTVARRASRRADREHYA